MDKDPLSPATTSAEYDFMLPFWGKINTLLAGTDMMRAAGKSFLPQHPKESDPAYEERLGRTTLLNMLQFTLDTWTGKPFNKPLGVGDDVPPQIKPLLEDVNMQGDGIDVFARQWFRDGISKGFSHVLVDFPRTNPVFDIQGNPRPRTLEDDNRDGLRPYLCHIMPENLIFAYAQVIQGVETLLHIRIRETEVSKVGFAQQTTNRIRVIEPGHVFIYEERKDKRSRKIKWVQVEDYAFGLPYIPLVTFYADRQGFMVAKPPLTDLGDLNIRHWQSTSDQIAVLTVARFPILACSGTFNDDKIVVGPNQWLSTPDPASRFYYVEHTGAAISSGRQDLVDLEELMSQYGATFLRKRPGGASATAHAIDNAEVTSPLQDMSIRFKDSLELAMMFFADWMGLKHGGSYSINTDFSLTTGDAAELTALGAARAKGDIGLVEYLNELKHLGVLAEDFNIASNVASVTKEKADAQAQAMATAQTQSDMAVKVATASKPTITNTAMNKTVKPKKAAVVPPVTV